MTSTNELLGDGIKAAKANKLDEALALLKRVVELEPRNEMAWLWLSAVVQTDEQRMTCLENVLTINPDNKPAQQGMGFLRRSVAVIKPLPERVQGLDQAVVEARGAPVEPLPEPGGDSQDSSSRPLVPAQPEGAQGASGMLAGVTRWMFSSAEPEREMTYYEALREMVALQNNPQWLRDAFFGFSDEEGLVQFALADSDGIESNSWRLDIPFGEGEVQFSLHAIISRSEALPIVRSYFAGSSARSVARAFLTAERARLSTEDEISIWRLTSASEPHYFLLDENARVACHVLPIKTTGPIDPLLSDIIEGLPLRLVSVRELIADIAEGNSTERARGPRPDGKKSRRARQPSGEPKKTKGRSAKLTACADCGGQVSTSATNCPHCGRPLGHTQSVPTMPRCPTCGSRDIEKISVSDKAGSAFLFGIFAIGRLSKSFRCRGCGYTW
jgi:hypothetical protein